MAKDERVVSYRLNAEKCLELANTFSDPESKRALLVMANAWLLLAEQSRKNSETILIYQTPTPREMAPDVDPLARRDKHTWSAFCAARPH